MIEKLKQLAEKYDGIKENLSDPAVVSDMEKYTSLMKEYKNLTPIVEKFREYEDVSLAVTEAEELLETPLDRDFKEIVE